VLAVFLLIASCARVQAQDADVSAPTPIEQALIENRCGKVLPAGALDSDGYRQCLKVRLASLRSAFGRDLEQVTRSERRTLDATCSGMRVAGREAYLDCLDAQLAALLSRRAPPAQPVPGDTTSDGGPTLEVPIAVVVDEERSFSSLALLVGAAMLGVAIAAAGGARLARTRRPVQHNCRLCGNDIDGAGDLCPVCRHEAAEAHRRAAADQEPKEESRAKPERQEKPEQAAPEPEARYESRFPQPDAESAAYSQEPVPPETPHEPTPRQGLPPAPESEPAFDPHAVLGVATDATFEDIRTAYEAAKSKYDAQQVAHLGYEVQKHYKAKARALERAYQLLAG
jgi:DnaJ-domain-containing protein 1